ncbi:MAG: hypothetical protein JSR91_14395 [Proteobacteria bacterium]|nr:hypothetical protein [Pseudomonadota bacterium]
MTLGPIAMGSPALLADRLWSVPAGGSAASSMIDSYDFDQVAFTDALALDG